MLRLASVAALVSLSGCVLYFTGDDGPDKCDIDFAEPAIAPASIRNPDTLACESYGRPPQCDPDCGPCPPYAEGAPRPGDGTADLAPLPSWGVCGSSCETLGENACSARSDCRVVKDAWCAIAGDCLTDFLGCFPTDMNIDADQACEGADAWQCSRNPACTAYHRSVYPSPAYRDAAPYARPFAFCADEGAFPGVCHAQVACRAAPPPCPAGTTPGVANSCYTGVCIPNDLCEAPGSN